MNSLKEQKEILHIDMEALMSSRHWRYLLYYILEPYGFNSTVLASLEDLLTSSRTISGKRFESVGYELVTGRNELLVRPSSVPAGQDIMPVRGAGSYNFNGRTFKVEVCERTPDMPLKQPAGVLLLDADKLRFPFVLRKWRSGDWLVPFGMRGKKKVSDLFADLKYDALQKESAVMIVDTCTDGMAESQHMAAVAGIRIDDRYKVTADTVRLIRII